MPRSSDVASTKGLSTQVDPGVDAQHGGVMGERADLLTVPLLASLPVRIDVRIPIMNFRLKHLLQLQSGDFLRSTWSLAEDLPVAAGAVRLLWSEFAVAERQLTVRVTRVA